MLETAIAESLSLPCMIGLVGDLGAGKTTFVKSLAKVLGVNDEVSSPTFALEHQYHGVNIMISHWDLYRIKSVPLELFEPPTNNELRIIEWLDRSPELLDRCALVIEFSLDTSIKIDDEIDFNSIRREFKLSGPLAKSVQTKYDSLVNK